MQLNLKNKKIVITGAARGIGLATALAFIKAGAKVILVDIDEKELTKLVKKYNVAGLSVDISDATATKQIGEYANKALKGIDIVVNNAGIVPKVGEIEKISIDQWDKVIDTNLNGAFWCTQGCIKYLAKSKSAAVINITSTQATHGQANNSSYCAAKGALENLTRALAIDLAPKKIRVNAVAPGFIDTDMAILPNGKHEHDDKNFKEFYLKQRKILLGRAGKPSDVTGAILLLASSASSYITGQTIVVDGGLLATY